MISASNYLQTITAVDTNTLPLVLQEGHQFFKEAEHLYSTDKIVKETIDLYLKNLNEYLQKGNTNSQNRGIPNGGHEKELTFIKRFVKLHNQVKTKQEIAQFVKALQQAIVKRDIRKSSVFAKHIEQIQNKLISRHNILPEKGSVKISINKNWLAELKSIINGDPSSTSFLEGVDHQASKIFPVKPKKKTLEIFDSMDDIKNEPSENSFRLKGDLGEFLGDLERFELAMTIEGDQGGGKTRFAYQLADAFAEFGDKVAVFSLEIGRKSDLIRRMREEYLQTGNLKNIFITDQLPEGLDTIKKAAKKFDVIILDSWNKVGTPSIEFDRLRKQYPNTVFIVIFQRTTQKMIRGGTAPLFDAGINIEVVKVDDTFTNNYAVATKNRYGVTGIRYSISRQKLEGQDIQEPDSLNQSENLFQNS